MATVIHTSGRAFVYYILPIKNLCVIRIWLEDCFEEVFPPNLMKKIRKAVSFCRLSVFVLTRITDKAALAVLFVCCALPFSLSRLSTGACLSLVHGCLSCLVLSYASYLIFILSYFAYLVCPSGCSKQEAMSLLQYFSRTHGAVTGLLKNWEQATQLAPLYSPEKF